MLPPYMLSYECGLTAGRFPKFEDDVYQIANGEGRKFMLPTAETALVNLYRDEILNESDLPKNSSDTPLASAAKRAVTARKNEE